MSASRPPPSFDAAELRRIPTDVLARHDVPGPRYTSYPTAPVWTDAFGEAEHEAALRRSAASGRPLSVYVHLPFCEALCIYCGCSVVITKRRERAAHYLEHLDRELDRVAELAGAAGRETVQVAWGGGTPTYLAPDQIEWLLGRIRERFPLADDAEVAIEVDPRVTTHEHVQAIARAGFNRISMGIQDFDPDVQREIHRVQPYELTRDLIAWCREAGLQSVNVDLVYGLPLQSLDGFRRTLDQVATLRPDRVSAFSYAHVPWLKPAQNAFREETLPRGRDKFELFLALVDDLTGRGYEFVGMDHFALPDNELAVAQRRGGLWRNFQGFTTRRGTDLVGLGMTSISSFDDAFAQNRKDLAGYLAAAHDRGLATLRGRELTAEDRLRRDVIDAWMCRYRLIPAEIEAAHGIDFETHFADALARLEPLLADGMIRRIEDGYELTSAGRVFVRNVCMAFDEHLSRDPAERRFSRTL